MMVDSGTTSHMTTYSDLVINQRMCNISIYLAEDSKTTAHRIGVRKVTWQGEKGPIHISLSATLIARDIRTSLLSVPALVKKNIKPIFLPGKVVFLDLLQKNKIIDHARQGNDFLFYISDNESSK